MRKKTPQNRSPVTLYPSESETG